LTVDRKNGQRPFFDFFSRSWTLDCFQHWNARGCLSLDAPYQRGDVWTVQQRQLFIRSLAWGFPFPSIITNDRLAANFQP
jgi:hypothetical protein